MKTLITLLLLSSAAFAQTPAVVMPSDVVATGFSWNRYTFPAISEITTLAIRIPNTNGYSWSTIQTPLVRTPAGQAPLPSSVRSGGLYVFAQTARVGAFVLGDLGLATTPDNTVFAYSGGMGLAFRPKITSHFLFMGLYRAISINGSGVGTVPEVEIGYSF